MTFISSFLAGSIGMSEVSEEKVNRRVYDCLELLNIEKIIHEAPII